MTTVATPLKNPGRLFPSMTSCNPFTSRNVPLCLLTSVVIPLGYRASTGGRNKAETLRDGCVAEARAAMSASRVRGYVARSSCGANWAGLTKIETIVWSHSDNEACTVRGAAVSESSARKRERRRTLPSDVRPSHGRLNWVGEEEAAGPLKVLTEAQVSLVQGSHRRHEPDRFSSFHQLGAPLPQSSDRSQDRERRRR